MKTAIATVSISGDLPDKIAAIAAAGFDGLEIFEPDFLACDAGPAEVAAMVRDAGLEITLFQPFRDFEGMPEPLRARNFERAERKFDLMQALGAQTMLVCSNVSPHALGGTDRCAADLRELGERAAQRGLRIGYEALAWGRHVYDHRDAWEIVRRADHPAVGLVLDSFHTLARRIDPDSIRGIPGDRIFAVQLADAPFVEMDLLYRSRHFRSMPGEGDLDVAGFMRAVAATGYDDVLSLEIFNDRFRGGSATSIAADGRRSLVYLMDAVRRSEPDVPFTLPDFPDRIAVRGIEFVEFAADETEAAALGETFRALGFSPAGQHISKSVAVWRQGDINLVINTEPAGYARSAYVTHGMSVCDIGLRVEDARATVARARALGAEPFEQAVGPGELSIPAIRGVGGSVLRFVDDGSELSRVWETEFRPVAGEGDPAIGLTRIDHLAQTMNIDELLTWQLFYSSLFRVEKMPMVDVVDPAGLVRSMAIENADGRLRLTLNGAENRRTLAGRFISESFGATVQHIAFATDDIFATAERLAERDFRVLPVPANYYDDLEARLEIGEERGAALRRFNILYDRDEAGGEFYQLYGLSRGERCFFEIVQRCGGYAGYGAANAPIRIAAQRRAYEPAPAAV